MRAPTSRAPQPFLFSTAPRLGLIITRLAGRPKSNLHSSSFRASNILRAFSSPALALTRPSSSSSSKSALPRGFLSRRDICDRKTYSPLLTSQARKVHCERRQFSEYGHSSYQVLKSQISSALYIIPLVVFGAFVFYGSATFNSEQQLVSGDSAGDYSGKEDVVAMEQLPGRPGNLTPEQDEKLRKFWEMFLQVCGVLGDDAAGNDTETASETASRTGTKETEKPKKSRMSLFKKKKDKEKGTTTPTKIAAMESLKENDPEDKWGENKAYLETLATHPPEQIRATIWSMVKHDHPDALLLRFLRARKWDLQRALVMLMSTMNWRCSDAHVDDVIMARGEEFAAVNEKSGDAKSKKLAEDFLAQLRMGKSFCYGADKAGRPICVVRARLHKAGEQSEEGLELFTVYLIETTRFMLRPPVDTACVLFDLTGFSYANMDYTPVKFMIKCFEANYPESLGVVLVHKAPWVFQGIWKIIKGWLDPVVASKVHFTNNLKDLEEFIDAKRIPDDLEGTSGYTYKYKEPVPGENAKMKDIETKEKLLQERELLYEEYESKTLEWINEPDAGKRAVLHAERDAIAKNLREQYWRLDPYLRSRSYYDRVGVIKPDGGVDYYPSPVAPTNGTAAAIAAGETAANDVD
ncbi:uncharacterized protein F4807DRAFT_433349 [Annulohypoxylon truncatum]|uniref:uncharacterized protein n=1 Tax=Annulohypoxylon truncatum TaxID=327061 RepID=UPI0020077558|nr:uncharacterized protein F4807DRAFT_433349 [Annulohypoxylon truncatum]KAI1207783.1 hypothetical protein F4807DRAFT_433349 [Annulohypoxylon truncatum]